MYRDNELRQHQYFVMPDWAGGVYASPAIAGSRCVASWLQKTLIDILEFRPGALIAGTWAVMQYMGEE